MSLRWTATRLPGGSRSRIVTSMSLVFLGISGPQRLEMQLAVCRFCVAAGCS